MLTVLSLVGGLLACAFVLAPLWQAAARPPGPEPPSRAVRDLLDAREGALAALTELEFDRSLGNLNAADYAALRTEYRTQAIGVLQTLETTPAVAPVLDAPRPAADPPGDARPARPRRAGARVPIAGGILVGLILIAGLGSMVWGAPPPSARPAGPPLPILHAHAALVLPGSTVVLVAHHSGLLRSTDDGLTWQPVAGIRGDVLGLAGAAPAGGAVYLAGPGGVQRSRDQGQTWTALPFPGPAGSVVLLGALATGPETPPALYVVAAGAGVYRGPDGQGWTLTGSGLPDDVTALVLRPGNLAALYAASPSQGVLASGDAGQSWGSASGVVNGALPTLATRALAVDADSGDSFTGPDGTVLQGALYVGTDRGMFKSLDGGTSWTALPLTEPLVAISARTRPTALLLAVDSRARVWRSHDHGQTWTAAP